MHSSEFFLFLIFFENQIIRMLLLNMRRYF